jgi:hypothetical protein
MGCAGLRYPAMRLGVDMALIRCLGWEKLRKRREGCAPYSSDRGRASAFENYFLAKKSPAEAGLSEPGV